MESVVRYGERKSKVDWYKKEGKGKGNGFLHRQYTSRTTCTQQNVHQTGPCMRTHDGGNKTVLPCAGLHAFILACKRVTDMKQDREPL